jgi:putative FmdB family regulatory protein
MPTYEFNCTKCLEHVSIEHRMNEPHPEKHDDCGGDLLRSFTIPAHIYRAGGFVTTDSRLTPDPDDIGEDEY